jgi:phosphoribosylformylglycinamidine cyclo-ligase
MLQKVEVHGLAHITGGGLRNLTRLNSQVCYFIEEPLSPHPIFTFIQKMGNVEPKEMYRTFNMGMGFVVILPKGNVDKCLQTLGNHAKVVGEVRKGKGVRVSKVGIIK